MTAGAHSLAHLCDVGLALLGCAHEMKDGPVVPDLVGLCGQGKLSDVSRKPSHPPSVESEPLTGHVERTLEMSSTVASKPCSPSRSSTSVEVPPPASMTHTASDRQQQFTFDESEG